MPLRYEFEGTFAISQIMTSMKSASLSAFGSQLVKCMNLNCNVTLYNDPQ